jgi:hypothetical protein
MEAALGAGITFKRGYVTEVVFTNLKEERFYAVSEPNGLDISHTDGSYEAFARRAIKRRQVLSGLPFPRAPTLKLSLGSQRIISAAALIRTILLGKAR